MILGITTILIRLKPENKTVDKEYRVEINRIYQEIIDYAKKAVTNEKQTDLAAQDFLTNRNYRCVKSLSYFKSGQGDAKDFFDGKGVSHKKSFFLLPLNKADTGYEYVRFEYSDVQEDYTSLEAFLIVIILGIWFLCLIMLCFVKYSILRPFHKIEQLPYELSKGHLNIELKENKYRYFGKFLWGLDALRELLKKNQSKQLELEKEKKMLILSVSHDIKTPLSSIYLYNKALKEGLYEEEKRVLIYDKLQQKAQQIEGFVAEIEKMSTEDLLELPVCTRDCYLKEILQPIQDIYKEKFALYHTEFLLNPYPNKLIEADKDRVIEVIENILENAIKYGDGKYISISSTEEEYCMLITIRNSGEAVEEKEFPHLFDCFWRGGNAVNQKGSGLGLYICKELMTKMNGDIYANREEEGMSFTIVLKEA